MEFKISMKAARVNANLTLKEAAKRIGVTAQTLVNWESGRTSPSIENAKKLSEVYGIALDFIFLV